MAKQQRSQKGIVPVQSRDRAVEPDAVERAPFRLGTAGIVALAAVALLILFSIAIPLRNYFQQRSEIAHIEASIAAKEAEIEQLTSDLERYQSEAYIKEQARLRLGVIEPGETAYRIVDPALDNSDSLTSTGEEVESKGTWYENLWDSVTTPEAIESSAETTVE